MPYAGLIWGLFWHIGCQIRLTHLCRAVRKLPRAILIPHVYAVGVSTVSKEDTFMTGWIEFSSIIVVYKPHLGSKNFEVWILISKT